MRNEAHDTLGGLDLSFTVLSADGLGEVWCNFPGCGAKHRAMLLQSAILPVLLSKTFADPGACFKVLQAQFQQLVVQSGEPGPIAQYLAGIDIDLWDLVAKRHKTPVYRLLGGTGQRIGVYANGINPSGAVEQVLSHRDAGHRALKTHPAVVRKS